MKFLMVGELAPPKPLCRSASVFTSSAFYFNLLYPNKMVCLGTSGVLSLIRASLINDGLTKVDLGNGGILNLVVNVQIHARSRSHRLI
jgi:hypothetical protein